MGLLDDSQDDNNSSAAGFGNAFGGAGNGLIAPFIGQQGLQAARDNTLISMGAAMMRSGARSKDPAAGSFLNALGSGLQAGQQAYQGSVDRGLQSANAAQQLMSNRYALMQRLALMQRFGQKYGLNLPGMPSIPGMPGAPGAPTAPGVAPMPPTGGLPPSGAPMAPQGASPDAVTPQATQPSAGGPPMDRDDLMMLSLMDPANARGYAGVYAHAGPKLERLPNGQIVDMNDPKNLGMTAPSVGEGMLPNGTYMPDFLKSQQERELRSKAVGGLFTDSTGTTPGGATYSVPQTSRLVQSGILPPNVIPGVNAGGAPSGAPGGSFPTPPGAPQGAPALPPGAPQGAPALPPGAMQTSVGIQDKGRLEGDQTTFNTAKQNALNAGTAAQNTLDRLSANRALIEQANLGKGAPAWNNFAQWLQQAGLLSQAEAGKVNSSQMLNNNQRQTVLENLKSTFPGRISNAEMNALGSAMGNTSDPIAVARYMNDMLISKTNRIKSFGDFMQGYKGDPGAYLQGWESSPQGSRSLLEDPAMLRHMKIVQGKSGQYGAYIPTDAGSKILRVQPDGQGGWQPAAP